MEGVEYPKDPKGYVVGGFKHPGGVSQGKQVLGALGAGRAASIAGAADSDSRQTLETLAPVICVLSVILIGEGLFPL